MPLTNIIEEPSDFAQLETSFRDSDDAFSTSILNPIMQDIVFALLTPLEILRLSRTCRLARDVVRQYIQFTFDINRILSRFFSDPLAFRSLQRLTGTLISGSCALQFFDRTFYAESDLDLYVPREWISDVVEWLVTEGYTFVPAQHQPMSLRYAAVLAGSLPEDPLEPDEVVEKSYAALPIHAVLTLVKLSPTGDGAALKIQCMVAKKSPMQLIFSFHSTCVMNVISFEKAYCLFPRATLHEHRSLVCVSHTGSRHARAVEKYRQRAFEMVHATQLMDRDYAQANHLWLSFPSCPRYLGDPVCWTIPLDTKSFAHAPGIPVYHPGHFLAHDPICTTSWIMTVGARCFCYAVDGLCIRHMEITMDFNIVRSPILGLPFLVSTYGLFQTAALEYLRSQRRMQEEETQPGQVLAPLLIDDFFVDWCIKFFPHLWSISLTML